jgi:serine/threonine protein kinase
MSFDLLLGQKFGSYQIISELGRGGMGKVYLAEHPTIGKKVAIKVLHQEFSKEESTLQRFFHEAKAVNDIRHQNVVDVLDVGRTEEGLNYLLMEYLNGSTLFDVLHTQGRFSTERIGHIGLQLCSALTAAHQRGIIHRDLKADNVFLLSSGGPKDFVKLLDFGIAKLLAFEVNGCSLTQDGFVLGTPAYMAPEQALGLPVDQQSDIYSFGVILYQMATGSLPFVDSNPIVVATMHVNAELPSPRERYPQLSPALEEVILTCLAKHKEDRYKNMIELALALSLACRVDPRFYFELELQEHLGTLLATTHLFTEPTVQSYVLGRGAAFEQEITEQYEAQNILQPTIRPAWLLHKVSGMGAVVMLGASVMLGLLYWGLSSSALAKEQWELPMTAIKITSSTSQEPPTQLAIEAKPTPIIVQDKSLPLSLKNLPQTQKSTTPDTKKKVHEVKSPLKPESTTPENKVPLLKPFALRPQIR